MHITTGESSEILCRRLSKALLNQWIEEGYLDGVWYNTPRVIAEKAISFVSLQEFSLRKCTGKLSTQRKNNLFLFWNALSESHIGIEVWRR